MEACFDSTNRRYWKILKRVQGGNRKAKDVGNINRNKMKTSRGMLIVAVVSLMLVLLSSNVRAQLSGVEKDVSNRVLTVSKMDGSEDPFTELGKHNSH